MTAPRHITAAYLPLFASFLAAGTISIAPGTQTTVIWSSDAPWRWRASMAPPSSFEVMNSLNLLATITYLPSPACSKPLISFIIFVPLNLYLLYLKSKSFWYYRTEGGFNPEKLF